MNSSDRLVGMMVIWVAFAIAAAATFWGRGNLQAEHVFIALFYTIAAVTATRYVVGTPASEAPAKKKESKVERLLESLSDDELDALRQRLSDDGELVSLNDVMRKERR